MSCEDCDKIKGVTTGSQWLHKNGKIYTVIDIANAYAKEDQRDEYPLTAVYKDSEGRLWCKPFAAFVKSRTLISAVVE